MNKKYSYITITMFVLALCACEPKPIEMEIKTSAPKIVITPLFNSENELGVLVTRSFSSLASMNGNPLDFLYSNRVSAARVSIENNGRVYELAGVSPVFVSGEISFEPYSQYKITVLDTISGEKVKAVTMMLPRPDVDSVALKVSRWHNDTSIDLRIKINDDGASRKYYLATFKLNQEAGRDKPRKSFTKKSLYDMIELFDNSSVKNGKLVYEKTFRQSLAEFGSSDSVIIDVSEVSRAYYSYLQTYKRTVSFINQLTGEPINFPTNVHDGNGFFFLLNPVYREFELGNY